MAANEPIPITPYYEKLRQLEQRIDELELKGGGGGGTYGPMEPRLAALETHVEHMNKSLDRLADVPASIAGLKSTVDELPRKGFIIAATSGALVLVAGISAFVQWVLHLQH